MSASTALVIVIAVLGFWMVGAYNRLVRLRSRIAQAFPPLAAQLRHRHDLAVALATASRPLFANQDPPLPHAEDARMHIEAVIAAANQARAAAEQAQTKPASAAVIRGLGLAEQVLERAFGNLANSLRRPELAHADPGIGERLAQIDAARTQLVFNARIFNESVGAYNDAIHLFPTRVVTALFQFEPASPLPLGEWAAFGAIA